MTVDRPPVRPVAALRRFAIAITVLNLLGHSWLGFEQSWLQPVAALLTAYGLELALEAASAWAARRRPRFADGVGAFIDSLLAAHITGLAVAMLLYANSRVWPVVFATTVAIGSKALLRVPTSGGRWRHVMNPSNFGISVTLVLLPWVSIAPPYQFTEALSGWGDWALPVVIVVSGSLLNALFTRRITLILAWLVGFAGQAVARHLLTGASLPAALAPMTGVAFVLFTFYMITDPATTPSSRRGQIAFGVGVAAAYGALVSQHVVFGMFFALTGVCCARGALLAIGARRRTPLAAAQEAPYAMPA